MTLGAWLVISVMLVWLRASSISADTAVMASGVSCTRVSRRVAVTIIFSMSPPLVWAD